METAVFASIFALKATVILALAFAAAFALRSSASSARYFVWTCALSAILILPLLSFAVRWEVAAPHSLAAAAVADPVPAAEGGAPPPADRAFPASRSASWLFGVWLFGAAMAGARLLAGHLRAWWTVRGASRLGGAEWMRVLAAAERQTRPGRRPELRGSPATDVPFSYGWIRPAIVLPSSSGDWTADRRRVVLLHELIHIRRQDWLWNAIAQGACAVYWFHPLAWPALSRFRDEQERSCDDAVLRAGMGQSAYAEHLVSLARAVSSPAVLCMAGTTGLDRRVEALLDPLRKRGGLRRELCAAALVVAVACVVPVAALRAQESRPSASLSGKVYDASGAVVPLVTILLKNADKTHQEIAKSGPDGSYQFASIPAGTYDLGARAPGFAAFDQRGIALAAGIAGRMDVKLDLGQVSETVEVIGKGPRPVAAGVPQRIRVGGNVQATRLVQRVNPVYPADAEAAGIEGTVLLKAVISTDGSLLGLSVVNTSVDARLAKAASDAVSQWRYQPTLLNGVPVEVVTTVTVSFKLSQ